MLMENQREIKCVTTGEIVFGYAAYLKTRHWANIRLDLKDERCVVCDRVPIQLHHITYERIGNEEPADIIALCGTHHMKIHDIRKKHKKSTQTQKSKKAKISKAERRELKRQRNRQKNKRNKQKRKTEKQRKYEARTIALRNQNSHLEYKIVKENGIEVKVYGFVG